ncbi:unnamed protein product [Closterium sp. Naga37s-1]|nr:unnamed protein product [Closterium sp. Naga37s-1]
MDRSKPVKYGLEIRRKPQSHRPATAAKPLPPVRDAKLQSLFGDDDDEDGVEADIARQNLKKRSQRETEQQHEAAMAEDPSVFDYDGVYDTIHAARTSRAKEAVQRQARYIPNLLKTTKDREKEKELVQERLLAKERAKEEEEYAGKERFVTRAYREKLAERQRWLAEEKRKEAEEAANDVTKRTDLTDLYRNLYRAQDAQAKSPGAPTAQAETGVKPSGRLAGGEEGEKQRSGSKERELPVGEPMGRGKQGEAPAVLSAERERVLGGASPVVGGDGEQEGAVSAGRDQEESGGEEGSGGVGRSGVAAARAAAGPDASREDDLPLRSSQEGAGEDETRQAGGAGREGGSAGGGDGAGGVSGEDSVPGVSKPLEGGDKKSVKVSAEDKTFCQPSIPARGNQTPRGGDQGPRRKRSDHSACQSGDLRQAGASRPYLLVAGTIRGTPSVGVARQTGESGISPRGAASKRIVRENGAGGAHGTARMNPVRPSVGASQTHVLAHDSQALSGFKRATFDVGEMEEKEERDEEGKEEKVEREDEARECGGALSCCNRAEGSAENLLSRLTSVGAGSRSKGETGGGEEYERARGALTNVIHNRCALKRVDGNVSSQTEAGGRHVAAGNSSGLETAGFGQKKKQQQVLGNAVERNVAVRGAVQGVENSVCCNYNEQVKMSVLRTEDSCRKEEPGRGRSGSWQREWKMSNVLGGTDGGGGAAAAAAGAAAAAADAGAGAGAGDGNDGPAAGGDANTCVAPAAGGAAAAAAASAGRVAGAAVQGGMGSEQGECRAGKGSVREGLAEGEGVAEGGGVAEGEGVAEGGCVAEGEGVAEGDGAGEKSVEEEGGAEEAERDEAGEERVPGEEGPGPALRSMIQRSRCSNATPTRGIASRSISRGSTWGRSGGEEQNTQGGTGSAESSNNGGGKRGASNDGVGSTIESILEGVSDGRGVSSAGSIRALLRRYVAKENECVAGLESSCAGGRSAAAEREAAAAAAACVERSGSQGGAAAAPAAVKVGRSCRVAPQQQREQNDEADGVEAQEEGRGGRAEGEGRTEDERRAEDEARGEWQEQKQKYLPQCCLEMPQKPGGSSTQACQQRKQKNLPSTQLLVGCAVKQCSRTWPQVVGKAEEQAAEEKAAEEAEEAAERTVGKVGSWSSEIRGSATGVLQGLLFRPRRRREGLSLSNLSRPNLATPNREYCMGKYGIDA